MPLTKIVDGQRVEMTAEEEAALTTEWQANAARPGPAPTYSKALLFGAMTDAEYDTWAATAATFPDRHRAIWDGASEIEASHPLFAGVRAAMVAAYGEARTDELLAAAAT